MINVESGHQYYICDLDRSDMKEKKHTKQENTHIQCPFIQPCDALLMINVESGHQYYICDLDRSDVKKNKHTSAREHSYSMPVYPDLIIQLIVRLSIF